jgi:hypothetical protein
MVFFLANPFVYMLSVTALVQNSSCFVKEYFVIIVQTIDFTVFAFSSSVLLEISAVVAFLLAK